MDSITRSSKTEIPLFEVLTDVVPPSKEADPSRDTTTSMSSTGLPRASVTSTEGGPSIALPATVCSGCCSIATSSASVVIMLLENGLPWIPVPSSSIAISSVPIEVGVYPVVYTPLSSSITDSTEAPEFAPLMLRERSSATPPTRLPKVSRTVMDITV